MKLRTVVIVGLGAAAFTFGMVYALTPDQTDVCLPETPDRSENRIGYKVIDLMRGQAWVSTILTPDEFEELRLGVFAPHWIKNSPRKGVAEAASVLRSTVGRLLTQGGE